MIQSVCVCVCDGGIERERERVGSCRGRVMERKCENGGMREREREMDSFGVKGRKVSRTQNIS